MGAARPPVRLQHPLASPTAPTPAARLPSAAERPGVRPRDSGRLGFPGLRPRVEPRSRSPSQGREPHLRNPPPQGPARRRPLSQECLHGGSPVHVRQPAPFCLPVAARRPSYQLGHLGRLHAHPLVSGGPAPSLFPRRRTLLLPAGAAFRHETVAVRLHQGAPPSRGCTPPRRAHRSGLHGRLWRSPSRVRAGAKTPSNRHTAVDSDAFFAARAVRAPHQGCRRGHDGAALVRLRPRHQAAADPLASLEARQPDGCCPRAVLKPLAPPHGASR